MTFLNQSFNDIRNAGKVSSMVTYQRNDITKGGKSLWSQILPCACPTEVGGRQTFTQSRAEKQLGITFSSKESKRGESTLKSVAVSESLLQILHSLKVSFYTSLVLLHPLALMSPTALGELRALLLTGLVSHFLKSCASRKQKEIFCPEGKRRTMHKKYSQVDTLKQRKISRQATV